MGRVLLPFFSSAEDAADEEADEDRVFEDCKGGNRDGLSNRWPTPLG